IIDYNCYTIPGQKSAAGYNFTTVGAAAPVPNGPWGVDVADANVQVHECHRIWVDDGCGGTLRQLRCGHYEQECDAYSYTDSRTVITLNGPGGGPLRRARPAGGAGADRGEGLGPGHHRLGVGQPRQQLPADHPHPAR